MAHEVSLKSGTGKRARRMRRGRSTFETASSLSAEEVELSIKISEAFNMDSFLHPDYSRHIACASRIQLEDGTRQSTQQPPKL
jgi:hypothetical protein